MNQKTQKKARRETEPEKDMRELREIIRGLGARFGEFDERTFVSDLAAKFKKYNLAFSKLSEYIKMYNDEHDILMELDVFLENDAQAMAVTVTDNLRSEDIDDHRRRMEKYRAYANLRYNDRRAFFGALAAAVLPKDLKRRALRQGFYVIEPAGESLKITPPAEPKAW